MKINRFIPYLLILFIFIAVYSIWIFNNNVLTSGDWIFIPKEALDTVRINYFSIWLNDYFGRILYDGGQAPTWALYGFLSKYFNMHYSVLERLIHLWPIILFLPFSSFFLLKKIFVNKFAILTGVLVYSFNTYFLILQTGHLTLMAAYAMAPFALLMFIKTLEELKFKYALITGLLLALVSMYEPRVLYLLVIILFLYFIYYLIFIHSASKNFLKLFFLAVTPVVIVGLLNFYWILGLLFLSNPGTGLPLNRELFGSEFSNIFYSITLHHPYWTGSAPAIFIAQEIKLIFWLVPITAVLGLYFNRKNKIVIFFGLIAIIGIFLSKQVAYPFQWVYPFLYEYLPGFSLFREASKFYFFISLAYAVLIAGFVEWLFIKKRFRKKGAIIFRYFLTIGIISIFLINVKPILNSEIKTLFIPRLIPVDYILLNSKINKDNEFFRTLWIPTSSRWSYYSDLNPKLDLILLMNFEWKYLLEKDKLDTDEQLYPFDDLFTTPQLNKLLDNSSVKYVLIPLEDNKNDDNFFKDYGEKRSHYIENLNKISYLKKVNIGTKEIVVYENEGYKPHIYLTKDKETINKEIGFFPLEHKYINPTKYEIYLKNIAKPVYINFSESFHPDWSIRAGDFNWFEVLYKNNYFLSNENHLRNDAGLNSFNIDPKEVCPSSSFGTTSSVGRALMKDSLCKRNLDGSYDMVLTLYFKPQSWFYLGLIISVGTLIIVLSYLVYERGKWLYEKKNKKIN